MAGKFLDLNEAAASLGVSTDQLMEMRQNGEIHGYRDGASWKFKTEEVERVKSDRAGGLDDGGLDGHSEEFDHLMPSGGDDEASSELDSMSILVSDEALGKSPPTSSSTIIGKKKAAQEAAADSGLNLAEEPSGKADSDLKLAGDGPSSDLKLAGESGVLSGPEAKLDTSAGGTGALELADEKSGGVGSDALNLGGSDLSLGEDSDDLVLGGSGIGSDVSLDPGGSGINLATPSDSGLSLEEPLELGGSNVEALELPEDEDMVAIGEAPADPDQATMLKADDEFTLTPMGEFGGEDSSGSGSQVIELSDGSGFDDAAATILGGGMAAAAGAGAVAGGLGGAAVLQEMPMADPSAGLGPVVQPAGRPQPIVMSGPIEASYSIWNVMFLLCVVMVMGLSGLMMVDLLRNMWAFDSMSSASSSVMDTILEAFKM